ncbi:hypothetical protein BDY19DRAFT_916961 [Irpex rosettiformis]|uniref:Uncharacterized protein n=1 Tax=Irpex rosettiformis TaxID=378272 RepID=A0ACB8UMB9_9APHY|nr:hypothetical protein BDY19DRAFT_916961 [Irpex rosettiformis]
MGKKISLKAALSGHQARAKKKQDAKQAAQVAEQKGKKPSHNKGKGKVVAQQAVTVPFKPTDRILLVGEGNFSFAHALLYDAPISLQHLPPSGVVATAYDSEEECYQKYPEAADIVQNIRAKGAEVIFGVDATKLEKNPLLRARKFDKVAWNFPHAGKSISDQDRNIMSNQLMLLGFLNSARCVLKTGPVPVAQTRRKPKVPRDDSDGVDQDSASEAEGESQMSDSRGTILITLRNVPPYTLWDLPKLAKNPPPPQNSGITSFPRYMQLRSFVFHRAMWKGYEHRMTKGERAHGAGTTGRGGEDRTWEFYLRD